MNNNQILCGNYNLYENVFLYTIVPLFYLMQHTKQFLMKNKSNIYSLNTIYLPEGKNKLHTTFSACPTIMWVSICLHTYTNSNMFSILKKSISHSFKRKYYFFLWVLENIIYFVNGFFSLVHIYRLYSKRNIEE